MSKHAIYMTLALCLAATAAWGAPPNRNHATQAPMASSSNGLNGATAVVLRLDVNTQTLVLRVQNLPQDAVTFSISPSCVYSGGLTSIASLHVNSRILVWTASGGTGTLPVVVKMSRGEY